MMLIAFALLATAAALQAQFSVIEVTCSGGIAGRIRNVRLGADGRLTRSGRRGQPFEQAGRMTAAEARILSERFDRAGFDTLKTLPRGRVVYDGVNCSIKRIGATVHKLEFLAGAPAPPPGAKIQYQEARAVMQAILNAGERVTLNPQPIPPVEPSRPDR